MLHEGYDFTKRRSNALRMVLGDGIELTLRVPNHGMSVFLTQWLETIAETVSDEDGAVAPKARRIDRDTYFEACAAMLSNNKECREITVGMLEEWGFDIDDVEDVFDSILSFLIKLSEEKN